MPKLRLEVQKNHVLNLARKKLEKPHLKSGREPARLKVFINQDHLGTVRLQTKPGQLKNNPKK